MVPRVAGLEGVHRTLFHDRGNYFFLQQEAKDLRKKLDEAQRSKVRLEEEVTTIRETVHRAAIKLSPHARQRGSPSGVAPRSEGSGGVGGGTTISQDLTGVMERLHHLENERKVSKSTVQCF